MPAVEADPTSRYALPFPLFHDQQGCTAYAAIPQASKGFIGILQAIRFNFCPDARLGAILRNSSPSRRVIWQHELRVRAICGRSNILPISEFMTLKRPFK